MRFFGRTIPLVLWVLLGLFWTQAWSQGGSAIITLVMPSGGENVMGGEAGVNEAFGALAGWNNPALLGSVHEHNLGSIQYARTHSNLLPYLGITDLQHRSDALSVSFPDFGPNLDLGLAGYYMRISFGKSIRTDKEGNELGTFTSREWVGGGGLGLRWKKFLSMGANLKLYHSDLSGDPNQVALGWVGDMGLQLAPTLRIQRSWMSIQPALGATLRNTGQWASYGGGEQEDPPPRSLDWGYALDLRVLELAWIHLFSQKNREWLPESRGGMTPPTHISGYGAELLCLGFHRTYLKDSSGGRNEMHKGTDFVIDAKRLWLSIRRIMHGDMHSSTATLLREFPLKPFTWAGMALQPNMRFVFSRVHIEARDFGIRDTQKRASFSLSL